MSTWQFALFAEDEWRLKPRVTLTYGLRYEYITPLSEANNQLGNFDPSAPKGWCKLAVKFKPPTIPTILISDRGWEWPGM